MNEELHELIRQWKKTKRRSIQEAKIILEIDRRLKLLDKMLDAYPEVTINELFKEWLNDE